MYTIRQADGTRDLTLEHGLSDLESEFAALRRGVLAKREQLSARNKLIASAFVAATQARTRKQRDHFASVWSGVSEDMEAIRQSMKSKTPSERRAFAGLSPPSREPSLGYEDVKDLAEAPMQEMLTTIIAGQVPILYDMDHAILSTDDPVGFITSDAPCVWFDPEAYKRPFLLQAPGLAWPTVEVTLPISPEQLLLINRTGLNGYFKVPQETVDELNRRTRGYAGDHFVVRTNEVRPGWYDMGNPPDSQSAPPNNR